MRHWLPPSAYDASRSVPGTIRSTVSDARVTIGSIVTARAIAAANPLFGSPDGEHQEREHEQAGDDVGQRGHGVDKRAHRTGGAAAHLGQVERGGDAERYRQQGRAGELLQGADERVTDAAARDRAERPVLAMDWVMKEMRLTTVKPRTRV